MGCNGSALGTSIEISSHDYSFLSEAILFSLGRIRYALAPSLLQRPDSMSAKHSTMTETRSDEVQNDHKQPSGEGGMKEAAELGQVVEISSSDADEARVFLENHPRGAEVRQEGQAILEDPEQHKNLVRKIDMVVMPLICLTYFLQYLDKTTLNVSSPHPPSSQA